PRILPVRPYQARARLELGERDKRAAHWIPTWLEIVQCEQDAHDGVLRRVLQERRVAASDQRHELPEPSPVDSVDELDPREGARGADRSRMLLELGHERIEARQQILELRVGHAGAGIMSDRVVGSVAISRTVVITRCRTASITSLRPSPQPSS